MKKAQPARRFTFFFEANVADPGYETGALEIFRDYTIVHFNGWRSRLAARLVKWLLPPGRGTPMGNCR